jgi:hypothetical protein
MAANVEDHIARSNQLCTDRHAVPLSFSPVKPVPFVTKRMENHAFAGPMVTDGNIAWIQQAKERKESSPHNPGFC